MDKNRSPSDPVQTSVSSEARKLGPERDSKVAWGITILSFFTLVLTLLGYGVTLAVETIFGVPHQTIYASALDLIGLSTYAVVSLVMGLGEIRWQPLFEQAWPAGLFGGLLMLFITCGVAYLRTRSASTRTEPTTLWRYLGRPTKQDSTAQFIAKGAIGSGLFGGLIVVTPFLIAGVVIATVVLMSTVPMYGMQLGANYFQKFVIGPTDCEPVQSRSAMLLARTQSKKNAPATATATCVTLLKDESRQVSGRVVVSTTNTIVLFEPVSGAARRIPIGELTVLPIGTVDTEAQPGGKASD